MLNIHKIMHIKVLRLSIHKNIRATTSFPSRTPENSINRDLDESPEKVGKKEKKEGEIPTEIRYLELIMKSSGRFILPASRSLRIVVLFLDVQYKRHLLYSIVRETLY